MIPPAGILSALRQVSPNISVLSNNNVVEIVIPKEDIIAQLRNSIPENIRNSVEIYMDERGVIMKVRLL